MGFFSFFGFGGHGQRRHHHGHSSFFGSGRPEDEMVANGRGVYAWIEKSGMFYSGDIPGVNGIMSVRMASSFEECLDELTENINDSSSVKFSSFRQNASYEEIQNDHPNARIVFISIKNK